MSSSHRFHLSYVKNCLPSSVRKEALLPEVLLRDYPLNPENALARHHAAVLRKHPFYQLDVHLRCGQNFPAKDACGTSDPYVKIKSSSRQLYKSRTISRCLNPVWDEYFCVPIDDVFQPLSFRVYDYDFVCKDDFIGVANLDLTQLELEKPTDMILQLTDLDGSGSCGTLQITVTLTPKTQEDKELYYGKGGRGETSSSAAAKKQKIQLWEHVVTIVLVEGKDLLPMDENGLSDPYVKFRLGSEKYKSKYCPKTLNPQWLEQFDLHLYPDQPRVLEVSVWDHDTHGKDDFMGRCQLNLDTLKPETTHQIRMDLSHDGGAGEVFLLLTISGTLRPVTDLQAYQASALPSRMALANRYVSVLGCLLNLM
ncbi:MCTP2 [Cordylochernes scorpioides]|uniref:MCTP2 n=1 Tax=Cordylochernes scorpioides TaxID=51811 RepID=A0ABY6K9Z7_9ARAC|nr:MCTP2 [Cordylochernes scorpioides]